jgi:Matrixin/Putative peptidoglycan binding domain
MPDHPQDHIRSVPAVRKGDRTAGINFVLQYLRRFGYLDVPGDIELSTGAADEATVRALESFQGLFGLPRTGEFDNVTREVMARPRCGLPDLNSSVTFVSRCPWRQATLSFAFDIGTPDIAGTELRAVTAAIATWQAVCPLTFIEVAPSENPNVLIGWRPPNDPALDMTGGIIAHADFPPDCSIITRTLPKPLHFDDEHLWSTTGTTTALDVQSVALHEFGHILGLQHSTSASAVMFPTIGFGEIKRELTQDDRDGISDLYSDGGIAD